MRSVLAAIAMMVWRIAVAPRLGECVYAASVDTYLPDTSTKAATRCPAQVRGQRRVLRAPKKASFRKVSIDGIEP